MATATELLREAAAVLKEKGIDRPWFEAQLLLGWALGKDQAEILALDTAVIPAETVRCFRRGVAARSRRKPFAYITGFKPFLDWRFRVPEGVLIPRPETECLVELAVKKVKDRFNVGCPLIADVGTGSGAIGLSMLMLLPTALLYATDCAAIALAAAKENAVRLGLEKRATFLAGDLLAPVDRQNQLACIVANLPYIPKGEHALLPPEIRIYEPSQALVSGDDGLCHYRRLLKDAWQYLLPGGFICVEIGWRQGKKVADIFRAGGFSDPQIEHDLAGLDRIVWAAKKTR